MLKRQARACGSSRVCDMVEAILEQMLCLAVSAVHHRGGTWRGRVYPDVVHVVF